MELAGNPVDMNMKIRTPISDPDIDGGIKAKFNMASVKDVVPVDDKDGTVCEAIRTHKPTYFANGGDRTSENTPEKRVCEELGVTMLWNVGGQKIQSSSILVEKATDGHAIG